MQRVVINKCYGGFSLSAKGYDDYLKRKGITGHFYVQERGLGIPILEGDYIRVSPEDVQTKGMLGLYDVLTEDAGERITHAEMWPDRQYHPNRAPYHRDIPRDDADLVAVVESDPDGASGSCAQLGIVEIPDGLEWQIEEYDGIEWVAEKHQVWS